MTDAFIYDHVRTPRGRGKPDGALHEVSTLGLAVTALRALRARNALDDSPGRRRRSGLRRPRRRSGRRHSPRRGARLGLWRRRAGCPDQPVLRQRARRRELRRGPGHGRAARPGGRRRRRIDEPRRHRGVRRCLAHGPGHRDPLLLHAARRVGRPHRHQIRLLARRRRRLCGRKPAPRRHGLGRRAGSRRPSSRSAT